MGTIFEIIHSVYLVAVAAIVALIALGWLAVTRFKIGTKRLEREAERLSRKVDELKRDDVQAHGDVPGVVTELEEYLEAIRRIIDRQRRSKSPLTLEEARQTGTLLDVTREIVKSLLSTPEPLEQVARCLRSRRGALVKALRGLGEQVPDRR